MPRVVPSQIVKYIDRTMPKAKPQTDSGYKGFELSRNDLHSCAGLIALINQIPGELIVLPDEYYIELVTSTETIQDSLEMWKAKDYRLNRIPGFDDKNPVSMIRRALLRCPDEFPSKATAELDFIQDDDLKTNFELDISATNQALSNGEWKATTVLAGSVIEALLLWALRNSDQTRINHAITKLKERKILTKSPSSSLDMWSLYTMIEVSVKLNIIEERTAEQTRLAKDFRNLIHPGREKRLSFKCNRGTALAAVAAVEFVVKDLAEKRTFQKTR